jgi:pyrimidine deaminase RibD-like protein
MDEKGFLNLAIAEAKKSKDSDKYYVGALVVKDGQILSKAHSDETTDQGHAEELAIKRCNENLRGTTIYTTIEPCTQRRPGIVPCTDLILNSGIKKVVYGVLDPKVKIPCNGIQKLKAAGIEVIHLKELEEQCKKITPSLF